ncbi:MAG: hypothetical protein ACJ754_07130 [Pyrinomonadaceae bacterium]
MLAKKLGFLIMMLLVLVALSQRPAAACGCSGDECGCGIAAQECVAECNGNFTCIGACRRENIACSKACCGF